MIGQACEFLPVIISSEDVANDGMSSLSTIRRSHSWFPACFIVFDSVPPVPKLEEHRMIDNSSDRRTRAREKLKTPIRVHIWKSAIPEELGESENLSEKGILFATDSFIPVGTVLEILLR